MHLSVLVLAALLSLSAAQDHVALVLSGANYCGPEPCNDNETPIGDEQCGLDPNIKQLVSAELFGCPAGYEVDVPDLPFSLSMAGGVFWPEKNQAIICGGINCLEGDEAYGNLSPKCLAYDPTIEDWVTSSDFAYNTIDYLMTLSETSPAKPLAIGGWDLDNDLFKSEVLTPTGWQEFHPLEDQLWTARHCFRVL